VKLGTVIPILYDSADAEPLDDDSSDDLLASPQPAASKPSPSTATAVLITRRISLLLSD
jgi:hypothetical protein